MKGLTAPANLLLMGEYAVLEPGGMGIILAPDIRAFINVIPADEFYVKGYTGNEEINWDPRYNNANNFFGVIIKNIKTYLKSLNAAYELPFSCIIVNTRNFYYKNGRKKGFGSSAAAAAGLTYALVSLEDASIPIHDIFNLSVSAHRAAQGGKGSGYDIAASLFGGVSVFTGGKQPLCRPCAIDWLPDMYIFNGPEKVLTVSAVRHYNEWKEKNPKKAGYYLTESNRIISEFEKAGNWESGIKLLEEYTDLAVWLGNEIDVRADFTDEFLPVIVRKNDCVYKALGAGNEVGIFFNTSPSLVLEPEVTKIEISHEGTVWR